MMELNPKWKMLLLALLLGLFLTACQGQEGLNIGDKAPDFNLPSSTGTNVSLSDFEGDKPVLLYFHMAVG